MGYAMDATSTPNLHRRSFLKAAGRFGKVAAAGSMLPPGLFMPGSLARLQAKTRTPELLIQPPEARSANGILDATITAACGPVQLGDHAFTDHFIMTLMCRRRYERASATSCGSNFATI
jgi:hypothetical protein